MQRRLAPCSDVAHEGPGHNTGMGRTVWVGPSLEKSLHNGAKSIVCTLAQCCVQGRFARIRQRPIHIRAELNEAIDEPDMTMKNRAIEIQVFSQLDRRRAGAD